jgi:cytochrome c biogenesis protein CcdA
VSEIWGVALPILLVDVANPVLLAAVILALSSQRPYISSLAMIGGHTMAYFFAGSLIILGLADFLSNILSPVLDRISNPQVIDYAISLVLGFILIGIATFWKTSPPKPDKKKPEQDKGGIFSAFIFGATVSFVGIPFALPYFAFINQLYKLEEGQMVGALLVYNVLYALPFLLLPASLAIFGKAVIPMLGKINEFVERHSVYILPVILGLVGLTISIDAAVFFVFGEGLY